MNGSSFRKITPGITIGGISPEASQLLETIMEQWDKHAAELNKCNPAYEPSIYGFAYWLCRWSGLIQPNTKPGEVPS